MNDKLYIIGHKNPDTDSICSAIGYAYLKKSTGTAGACPARLGDINKETEYVLNYFGVELPELISTVKMQVADAGIDRVIPISPDITILKAWTIMKEQNVKTLPVVNESGGLLGICTLSDLTNSYMDVSTNNLFSCSGTTVDNVVETLKGKKVNDYTFDFSRTKNIVLASMDIRNLSERVSKNDIVITGNRTDAQREVIKCGASCLIITGGIMPESSIIDIAGKYGCMILSVPYDSFTAARLINQSIPVRFVMTTKNIISFDIDDYIDDVKETMLESRYRAYPVLKDGKVIGTISRYHLIKSNKKKVILVDHNERSQSVDGLEEAEILEIIDHHRVGDIQTAMPISFNNKPLGSTSTMIGNLFFEMDIEIPPKIAGILCAAIISDTLLFKSPTCTKADEIIANKLAEIAGIDIYEFGKDMFNAATSILDKSVEDIFYQDFKDFLIGKRKIGISQVMTMDIDSIEYITCDMLAFMEGLENNKGYDIVILVLTDIIKEGSKILFTDRNREIISKAFNAKTDKNSVYLPEVMSRKKQVVPPVAAVLNK